MDPQQQAIPGSMHLTGPDVKGGLLENHKDISFSEFGFELLSDSAIPIRKFFVGCMNLDAEAGAPELLGQLGFENYSINGQIE